MDKNLESVLNTLEKLLSAESEQIMRTILNKRVRFTMPKNPETILEGKVIFVTQDISFSRWYEVLRNNHKRINNSTLYTNLTLMIELDDGKVKHINIDRLLT